MTGGTARGTAGGTARGAAGGLSSARRVRAVRLRGRSVAAIVVASLAGVAAFGWPFLAPGTAEHAAATGGLPHSADAPWIFVALLPLLLAVVMAQLSDGGLDTKAVAMLGVLAACGAALRPLGGGVTSASPVFFLLIPAGRVLGRGFGFVLGAVTLFASALLTGGVGPWLPFQMLATGWVGFFAGCLPPAKGRLEVLLLAAYGAVAGLLFGALMNLWFWPFLGTGGAPHGAAYLPGAGAGANLAHYWTFYLTTSLGYDVPRALTNAALVLVAGPAVLLALRRAARRAAFDAPVEFVPAAPASPGPSLRHDQRGKSPENRPRTALNPR